MALVLPDYLCPDGFAGPRGLRPLLSEARVVREVLHAGHLARWRVERLSLAERSSPAEVPVLLIPGFLAGDLSLRPLAGWLRLHGYRTYRAQIRSNVACTRAATERLEQRVVDIADRRGHPVALVGHSLGGLLAKGVATRRPDLVSAVVTLGSPLLAPGAVHLALKVDLTVLAGMRRLGVSAVMGSDCIGGDCARLSWDEVATAPPPDLPYTSLYSRRDGIVDWRSCLDPRAQHVEVGSSHLGMALDRVVWSKVAAVLDDVGREAVWLRATG